MVSNILHDLSTAVTTAVSTSFTQLVYCGTNHGLHSRVVTAVKNQSTQSTIQLKRGFRASIEHVWLRVWIHNLHSRNQGE